MKTKNPEAVAAATSVAAQRWPHLLNELIHTVVDPHLARPETRATAHDLIRALLAPLTRKNCWTLAEHTGHSAPYRMQHLLSRARLDEQALTVALRGYVTIRLGCDDVVLVVDETGDVKKGQSTVGVARQYSGTAGRTENCQVAVYLAYTTPNGHALIDHRLYLPRAWTDDAARLQRAGVRWVLIRRNRTTAELAFYRCYAPEPVPLARLVAVAGRRWRVEESFQQGKGLAGLDEHQVRAWTSWQRWSLLAMVAYAFVAVCRQAELRRYPVPDGLVALTCNEIARLLHALFASRPDAGHVLAWSVFRHAHQARARDWHYRRQTARES
ncbi:SRSO17 transposase [Nocardiopsis metallicus]|uniref:SRSO17 transposase n=1 Tax=Nocardiopsis metallicus TaxID=179819 RepID=A0A840WRW5_9ACTN|nr:SRSO17 transposase [Nocardiopsis metallicus]